MKKSLSGPWFQRWCQVVALVLINGNAAAIRTPGLYQGPLKSICLPVLQCHSCPVSLFACPMGSLQYFIMTGRFSVYLSGIIGLVGVTAGRIGCGLLCPFGLIQDILFKLGTVRIPLPAGMAWIKYGILLGIVGLATYFLTIPAFCKLCPVAVLEAGYPHAFLDPSVFARIYNSDTHTFLGWLFLFKTLLLTALLLAAVRIKRPFCRILCPLGALFGLFNRFSIVHISVDTSTCNSCQRCARICPVDLDIYRNPDSPECILCMKCTSCKSISVTSRLIPFPERTNA